MHFQNSSFLSPRSAAPPRLKTCSSSSSLFLSWNQHACALSRWRIGSGHGDAQGTLTDLESRVDWLSI